MLSLNTTPSQAGRVNLKELAEVRQFHMPPHAVKFAKPCQLKRVAHEVSLQRPELREEAHFVLHEELHRRQQLAVPMLAVKGGQQNG